METKRKQGAYYLKATIFILIILTLSLAITYAWLTISLSGTKTNDVIVGTLSLKLDDEESEAIYLENATPVYDYIGLSYTPYTFSLTNDGNVPSNYIVYLDNVEIPDGIIRMNDKYIKCNIVKNNVSQPNVFLSDVIEDNSKVIDKGTLEVGQTNTYDMRLWIDKDVDNKVMSTMFAGRIRVEAEQIKE